MVTVTLRVTHERERLVLYGSVLSVTPTFSRPRISSLRSTRVNDITLRFDLTVKPQTGRVSIFY